MSAARWSMEWWLDMLMPKLFGLVLAGASYWYMGRLGAPDWARWAFSAVAYFYGHDDVSRRPR
jgi:hypothetical protein